ncbi:MAG: hypothetical protein K6B46_05620 [Opitutales bacterium]|nr:hypothetical protein [Opitutales bacterium]
MKALIFFIFAVLAFPCAVPARTVELFTVFDSSDLSRDSHFYVKSGGNYRKLIGENAALPTKSISIDVGDEIEIFLKNESGDYLLQGSAVVPADFDKCGLLIFPETKRRPFTAKIFDADKKKYAAGTVYLINLTEKSLRGTIDQLEDVRIVVPAGETETYHCLSKPGEDLTVRIVAAADSRENVKRTWRYGNNLHVGMTETYLIIVAGTGTKLYNGRDLNEILILRWSK